MINVLQALKNKTMDQLDMLPSEEDLHLLVDNFTGQLPALQSLGVGDGIKGGLAILPWQLKDEVNDDEKTQLSVSCNADLVDLVYLD